jgi:alcohol dehydrogenase class IV
VAIIDPALLTTLSQQAVAGPGLDALYHAIESYIARKANPMSETLALRAMSLLVENLPLVYDDRSNLEAWEKVVFANTLAGMAIDVTATAMAHGMAHPVSGKFDTAHGESLAALFIQTMEFSSPVALPKFATIAKAMGENIDGLTTAEAAAKSVQRVKDLMARVNMMPKLSDFGVSEQHVEWLSANALKTMKVVIENNPRVPTQDDIRQIYRSCL